MGSQPAQFFVDERQKLPLLQRFDRHGVAFVHRWDLGDALSRIPTAPVVALDVGSDKWVATQARIIDVEAIEQWLFNARRDAQPAWVNWLNKDFGDALLALAWRLDGAHKNGSLPLPGRLPRFFKTWATEILACIWVFSGVRSSARTADSGASLGGCSG